MSKQANGREVGRQVDELVGALDLDAAPAGAVAETARRIAALGRKAVAHLARRVLRRRKGERGKVAALLACLSGREALWASAELAAALHSPELNPAERMWLSVVAGRLCEDGESDSNRSVAEALQDELLEDEEELILWRDEFACLSPDEQEAVLAPLMQDGNPAVLRLLEAATSLQSARVDAAVAGGLARFGTPAALPLLRELLRRPDPVVRKRAQQALAALERQGVATSELFVAADETPEPVVASLMSRPGADGQFVVLVARGRGRGRVRFAAIVVDPVELGIATAWGGTDLTMAEFGDLVADYAERIGDNFMRVDLALAQSLVAAGEDLTVRRGQPLPPDYVVWRRCIGRPRRGVALPVAFAPACCECGGELRGGDIRRGGMVVGRAALCARCAAKPRACVRCGRALSRRSANVVARESADRANVEFLCAACARAQRKGTRRRG